MPTKGHRHLAAHRHPVSILLTGLEAVSEARPREATPLRPEPLRRRRAPNPISPANPSTCRLIAIPFKVIGSPAMPGRGRTPSAAVERDGHTSWTRLGQSVAARGTRVKKRELMRPSLEEHQRERQRGQLELHRVVTHAEWEGQVGDLDHPAVQPADRTR